MSVLVDKNTRLLVQGLTGREGAFHAVQAVKYGTQVVGGVTPGKGGMKQEGIDASGPGGATRSFSVLTETSYGRIAC